MPISPPQARIRFAFATAAGVVLTLGLASRKYRQHLPPLLDEYAGDTLWALLLYLLVSMLFAGRPRELEHPVESLWPPILIETLRDNVASKMNALVERGAPRDFVDIQKVVQASLFNVPDCWQLWMEKNPGQPIASAQQKVTFHLSALEMRRPLEAIADTAERAEAEQRRTWFKHQFLQSQNGLH